VDDNGELPLHYACFRGNIKNITCLLDAGASPDVRCVRNENSLMCTLRTGYSFSADCIALLVKKSQSPTSYVNQTFYSQETVMHRAACTADLTVLKELVAGGGDMKAERRDGVTPLQLLGMNGLPELEHFYDSESLEVLAMENSEGVSCLTYAILHDSGRNIEYILNRFTDDMIMTKCPDMWKLAAGNDRFNAISALARLDMEDDGNKSGTSDVIRMFSDSWIHSNSNSVSSWLQEVIELTLIDCSSIRMSRYLSPLEVWTLTTNRVSSGQRLLGFKCVMVNGVLQMKIA
jgi:hypothetical protein